MASRWSLAPEPSCPHPTPVSLLGTQQSWECPPGSSQCPHGRLPGGFGQLRPTPCGMTDSMAGKAPAVLGVPAAHRHHITPARLTLPSRPRGQPSPEAPEKGLRDHGGGGGTERRGGWLSHGSEVGVRVVLGKPGPVWAWLLGGQRPSLAPHADPHGAVPGEASVPRGPRALPSARPRRTVHLSAAPCPGRRSYEVTVVMGDAARLPRGRGRREPGRRGISGNREAGAPERRQSRIPESGPRAQVRGVPKLSWLDLCPEACRTKPRPRGGTIWGRGLQSDYSSVRA